VKSREIDHRTILILPLTSGINLSSSIHYIQIADADLADGVQYQRDNNIDRYSWNDDIFYNIRLIICPEFA
jgi:hypothetical protein